MVYEQRSKYEFLQPSVEYLGNKVDAQRLHTTEKKVEAILKVPQPRNVAEFHSFLGIMANSFLTYCQW